MLYSTASRIWGSYRLVSRATCYRELEPKEEEPEEEEPEEEVDMDMDIEGDSDDEMDGLELIIPYEAMGSPYPQPPKLDTSSDSKPKDALAATVGTITQCCHLLGA
ncbi:hypothetical protein Tco_1231208, partial [Tanacetum coccineum]